MLVGHRIRTEVAVEHYTGYIGAGVAAAGIRTWWSE